MSVTIPTIGVHVTALEPLDLNPDGSLQTPSPDTPTVLGWYTQSSPACAPGPDEMPFTVTGHINSGKTPGVLTKLANIKTGDTVTVGLSNGDSCVYKIGTLITMPKAQFDPQRVWAPTPAAALNVISCGGPYVGPRPPYYPDNLIARADLVTTTSSDSSGE